MFTSLIDYLQFYFLVIDTQSTTFLAVTLFVLLFLTFIISGAEVAIFSLTKQDINVLKTKTNTSAKRVINLLEEPKEVYASLMIAGTFVNISIILLSNFLITQFVSFGNIGLALEILIKVLMIAFVLVFIGKILPKVWATQHNIWFAYGASAIIEPLHLLLRRISKWIVKLADNIGKRAGADRTDVMSIKEMDEAIDIKTDEEASPEEKNIMKGIVKFGNITVKQIMRSRLDVSGIEYKASFGAIVKRVEELHYSRLPVYKGSLDNVLGVIYTKDLIQFLNEPASFDWHHLVRQPYFVPEPKLIEDLLKEFQQKRIHFAIVVDEFGGTSGIVTMEDILEEIIGDIKDEFDEEETVNRKIDDQNYIFEGKVMLHDLCKIMQLPMDTFESIRGESESLAGLVLELAEEFPSVDTVLERGDFLFTVLKVENNRLQQIKVTVKPLNN